MRTDSPPQFGIRVWLACIAHKSLKISERCKAMAAEFAGYAGNFAVFLEREVSKQFLARNELVASAFV